MPLASAEAGLKSREPSAADKENLRLRAKVGELTMEVELLREKASPYSDRPHSYRLEDGSPANGQMSLAPKAPSQLPFLRGRARRC
jgi:hypothetical protein